MSDFVIPEYRVPTDRLRIGVFIRLEGLKWHEHPFLFKNFKIANDDQIKTLREMGIKEVICVPGKSDCQPLNEAPQPVAPETATATTGKSAADELWQIKQERVQRLKQQQETIARCEQNYVSSQQRIGQIMTGIAAADANSARDVAEFAESFSANFLQDTETALHLMRFAQQDETIYYHSMNVAVLAMILGKEVGIQAEEMKILCQGALFHDIGKSKIDPKVLLKEGRLNKAELDSLKMHPNYGVNLLAFSETFPKLALNIVYQHHEAADGSGYPTGIRGLQIHLLSKLVSIADTYDNHCNKHNPADSLTPYEALSYMFSRQKNAFDEKLLAAFIKCLGIYPPGTVVQLNNGAIGIVITVNPKDRLNPSVLLYDSEISPQEAPIIDMHDDPDLKVTQSIRPVNLPRQIFDYLSPRTRITYYVNPPDAPAGEGAPL